MSSPTFITLTNLYAHYLKHREVTTDSRKVPANSLFFALKGDNFDGNQYAAGALEKGAAYAVVDNAKIATEIGARALLVEDGLQALQDLANHHRRQLKMPILAITGSNGKTTTKELVASVMSRRYRVHFTPGNFNNHIGLPLTILQIGPEVEMAILEMGANHQGEIADLCRIAEPTHGLITNIGEAHLEGFGGIEGVKIGKGELYDYLAANRGIAFVNLDAEFLPEMAQRLPSRINYKSSLFPSLEDKDIEIQLITTAPNVTAAFLDAEAKLIVARTQLPGAHNFENIKAAIAIGRYFKVAAEDIAAGLAGYRPENNRSQRRTHRSVNFFLDAYNANPSSTAASLVSFCHATEEPRTLILGDMLELGQEAEAAHARIARLAQSLEPELLLLIGPCYFEVSKKLGITHFNDVKALKKWFWQQNWTDHNVLIKGSRGMRLEQLLED